MVIMAVSAVLISVMAVNGIATVSSTFIPPVPPPVDEVAKMARYIVHNSDWCSLTYISHAKNTFGYPMARDYSVSDGQGAGVPYVYTPGVDVSSRNLLKYPQCSMTMSLAQGDYCSVKNYDPEDPRCAQVILSGKFTPLKNGTRDWLLAKEALFSRHPVMASWPEDHQWFFSKLVIKSILVVDWFGGNKYPSVEEYFKAYSNEEKPVSMYS